MVLSRGHQCKVKPERGRLGLANANVVRVLHQTDAQIASLHYPLHHCCHCHCLCIHRHYHYHHRLYRRCGCCHRLYCHRRNHHRHHRDHPFGHSRYHHRRDRRLGHSRHRRLGYRRHRLGAPLLLLLILLLRLHRTQLVGLLPDESLKGPYVRPRILELSLETDDHVLPLPIRPRELL